MAAERNVVSTLDPVRPNTTELNAVCSDVPSDRTRINYITCPHYYHILLEVN